MKIAVFHELPRGGARRAINQFAYYLKKNNQVDLYVVDERNDLTEKKFYTNTFFYKFLPKEWKGKNWKKKLYKDTLELINLYLYNKRIAHTIDKKSYDVVFVSASRNIEAPFIMRFLKTPFIFYCSDPSYRIIYDKIFAISKKLNFIKYTYEKVNRYIRKILDRQNIDASELCMAPSKFIAKKFTKIYKKENSVLYYGVDSRFFSPGKVKKDIDIFYIGSYDPVDDYKLLLDTLKYMKFKPTVRKLLSEEEWISDDRELLAIYQRSKIMFCPARNEGLGAGPMEGMSCGLAVVAVNEAGHKEIIIDGKTGYLVRRDPKAIAKLIDSLLINPEQIELVGKQARESMVHDWSWKTRARELEKVLLNHAK